MKLTNRHIEIFLNNYIAAFRLYNNDRFSIEIRGLSSFIDESESNLVYLLSSLECFDFSIKLTDDMRDTVSDISIVYSNTGDISKSFTYQLNNLSSLLSLSNDTNIHIGCIIIMKIISYIVCKNRILYKAVVLDLDETLWPGIISEDSILSIKENLSSEIGVPFVHFMNYISLMSKELGIFIAIATRNNLELIQTVINQLPSNIFPIKDHIDYIIANDNDKSQNILKIAEQLSILPNSIVFIDDNPIIRDEVKAILPHTFVPDWINHYELITVLNACCVFERYELSLLSRQRKKQYKLIQSEKKVNKLPSLYVQEYNDDGHKQSKRLYSKSNQFKFSNKDIVLNEGTFSSYFELFRPNGDSLGICSAMTYKITDECLIIINWAISCRYFSIGLEEFLLLYIIRKAFKRNIFLKYMKTDYNIKTQDLIDKYKNNFLYNKEHDILELVNLNSIMPILKENTNLIEKENG